MVSFLPVVNNWFVFSDGYSHVVGTDWARVYFVIFWGLCVVVALNVVITTVVEQFTAVASKYDQG